MRGCIRKKSKSSWQIVLDLGRGADGRRRQRTLTVRGNKKQAEQELSKLLVQADGGIPLDPSKETVAEFLDRWVRDYAEANTSARTVEEYQKKIRCYVVPTLGHVPLGKLGPTQIQGLYAALAKRGLSARTILHAHRLLKEAMGYALRWGLVYRNPCEAVTPPRVRKTEMSVLDTADIPRFVEAIGGSPYAPIYFMALHTGMRRGEVMGLRWLDVDLRHGTLEVNQSVGRLLGKGLVITEPKTSYSRRTVVLPSEVTAMLGGLKARQKEQLQAAGLEWDETALVFRNARGGPMSPDTVSHNFRKIIKRAGLPPIRFHDLRHSHTAMLLKAGVQPLVVSRRLGHSSVAFTLDQYGHVLPGQQQDGVRAFEKMLQDEAVQR